MRLRWTVTTSQSDSPSKARCATNKKPDSKRTCRTHDTSPLSSTSALFSPRVSSKVWNSAIRFWDRRRRRDRAKSGASFDERGRVELRAGEWRVTEAGQYEISWPDLPRGLTGNAREVVVIGGEEGEVALKACEVVRPEGLERANLEDVACAVARHTWTCQRNYLTLDPTGRVTHVRW